MPYLTPNSLPSGTICRTVLIPDDLDWLLIVNGALSELCNADNFEQFGSVTPEEAAERFQQMFFEFRDSECAPVTPIGSIVMWSKPTPPPGWLMADGTTKSRTDYSDLFTAIGTAWGGGNGTTTFTLPGFSGRSPMGVGNPMTAVADEAGNVYKDIEIQHLPAHAHGQQVSGVPAYYSTGGAGRVGYGAVVTANTTRVNTDPVGDGVAFEVLHPVKGVYFIIYAGDQAL